MLFVYVCVLTRARARVCVHERVRINRVYLFLFFATI